MNTDYQKNKGDSEFGMIIIVFLAILFVIWFFTGGPTKPESEKPFITPGNDPVAPLEVYGPNDQIIQEETTTTVE